MSLAPRPLRGSPRQSSPAALDWSRLAAPRIVPACQRPPFESQLCVSMPAPLGKFESRARLVGGARIFPYANSAHRASFWANIDLIQEFMVEVDCDFLLFPGKNRQLSSSRPRSRSRGKSGRHVCQEELFRRRLLNQLDGAALRIALGTDAATLPPSSGVED